MNHNEPMITMPIREYIQQGIDHINTQVGKIEANMSFLTTSVEQLKEVQSRHYEDCPNTPICKDIGWVAKHWAFSILGLVATILISSAALSTAYDKFIGSNTVTVEQLNKALQQYNITDEPIIFRGGEVEPKTMTPRKLEEEIESINK